MKKSLKGNLILSYLAVALLTVLVVSLLIRLISVNSLMNLVAEQQITKLTEAVQNYYISNGSLDGFASFYANIVQPLDTGLPAAGRLPAQHFEARDIRGVVGLLDANYRAVLPTLDHEIGQVVPRETIAKMVPIDVNGHTIAYLLPDLTLQFKLNSEEQLFLERSTIAIGLSAVAGVLVAVAIGFFLAGTLLKPIRRLTSASREMARGHLAQQVPVTSQDELGELSATFNQMSADLLHADQERKRMTADITHDLSTPLQIIAGYVEMLEEGDVELTPQRLEIIKTEIEHLRRLVGDLTTLNQLEAGSLDIQPQIVAPATLLERIYLVYLPIAERQGVGLVLDAPSQVPEILVDEGRMLQVLKNLIENAMRYTPKGGQVRLGANAAGGEVELRVTDSGSGIDPEDLPYVFDRFYQGEKARGANSGKMGLGLSICRALVQAQGGQISAESAGLGQGTSMVMTFPAAGD